MKSYKIGDISIAIDSDIKLSDYDILDKFIYSKNDAKYDALYKVKTSNPYIFKDEKMVFKSSNMKVYNDRNKIYRIYGMNDLFGDYACVEFEKDSSQYTCNIYKGKEEAFYSTKHLLELLVMEDLFLKNNSIVLHSANILFENKSILFTAPSGTGKSTQANLWNEVLKAKIINGDRTLIKKIDNKYFAMGIPFCGSSNICENERHPIGTIVVLRQGNENYIRKLSKIEAYKKIISEVTVNIWDKNSVLKVSDIVEDIINNIEIIELTCLPNVDAVILLRDYLKLNESKGA